MEELLEDLMQAMDRYSTAKKQHDEQLSIAKWDVGYHLRYHIKELEDSKTELSEKLNAYIDARVRSVLGEIKGE